MTGWVLILIFVLVIVLIMVMMMPSAIKLTPDSLKIGKSLAIEIPFEAMEEVYLKTQYPKTINRVHGVDSGDIKIGVFETPNGQRITMNLFLQYPPFIEVIHPGGLLVFNFNNPEKTEKLYEELRSRLQEKHG